MRKLLSFVRSITTFTPRCTSIASSSPNSLLSDSYYETNAHVGVYYYNRRINDWVLSGSLRSALQVFDEMPIRDVVSYNLLISGHGRYGHPGQAFLLYSEMVSQGIRESASTFSSVLSLCGDAGFFREGIQVHCRVVLQGFGVNLFVGSSLVDLYMHIGFDDFALKSFDDLPERNLVIWNLVLCRFCELGRWNELLGLYDGMKLDAVEPNGLTFCYLIRSSSNGRFLDEGKQLHCDVIKTGWIESNLFVANALVDFYSACGSLIDAAKSSEAIPVEDVISWNSIVSAYADNGFMNGNAVGRVFRDPVPSPVGKTIPIRLVSRRV